MLFAIEVPIPYHRGTPAATEGLIKKNEEPKGIVRSSIMIKMYTNAGQKGKI